MAITITTVTCSTAREAAQYQALVQGSAPVRQPRKAAPAKPRKAAPQPKAGRKSDTVPSEMTRKDWNRTLTAQARLAGKSTVRDENGELMSVYALVLKAWNVEVAAMREDGYTPAQVIAAITR